MKNDVTGRILLVDHSRGSLMFQETILRRRETIIITALSGSEALLKARDEQPQLVIFSFDLFDMTAPEFCREIRSDSVTRGISLLLVSERETDHPDLCLAAGCNDVIYRPLQRIELDGKVQKLTSIPVRRELRTITKIEVSLEKNGRFYLGRSVNVSSTGMLIEVDRVLQRVRRTPPVNVSERCRIAEDLREIRQHRLDHARVAGRGGVVVNVNGGEHGVDE